MIAEGDLGSADCSRSEDVTEEASGGERESEPDPRAATRIGVDCGWGAHSTSVSYGRLIRFVTVRQLTYG